MIRYRPKVINSVLVEQVSKFTNLEYESACNYTMI